MIVETDKNSGFCFGVENAVKIAETALSSEEKVYSLGTIVHNDKEVERLSSLGLTSIDHETYKTLRNCRVLIRAHGEPPETYDIAGQNGITIIEATCPIVKRLQSRIKQTWLNAKKDDGQIVLFGKPGHAEVIGLIGQTNNEGILVRGVEDIELIDMKRPIYLFSQTTMSVVNYEELIDAISQKMNEHDPASSTMNLHVHNTICNQVSNREPSLKEFAAKHDVILFVSGKDSSNGKMLFSICHDINPQTYFISSPEEIDTRWFTGKASVGICGATSTPKWLIENILQTINAK